MARTDPLRVSKIIDVEEDDDLEPYISSSNELVTELCTASGYTDTRLELIERWLAAHFYDINRGRASLEQAGPVQQVIENIKVDLGLNNTKYGQQAMRLDTAGNLAALENIQKDITGPIGGPGGKAPCALVWLGTPKENWPTS